MFREFREAWRQTVDNFWTELRADDPVGSPSDSALRQVAVVRNQLDRLEIEIRDTRTRLAEERKQAEVCRRRETMARTIGDHETARIAAQFATRHAERAAVLDRKAEALEAERGLCLQDLEEMEQALQNGLIGDDSVRPDLLDLDRHPSEDAFRDLEDGHRGRTAEERLEELKRRMGRE